jgi:hypothetical protein
MDPANVFDLEPASAAAALAGSKVLLGILSHGRPVGKLPSGSQESRLVVQQSSPKQVVKLARVIGQLRIHRPARAIPNGSGQ